MAQARRAAGVVLVLLGLLPAARASARDEAAHRLALTITVLWIASDGRAFVGESDRHFAEEARFYFRQYGRHPAVETAQSLYRRGFVGPRAVRWAVTGSNAQPAGAGPQDDIGDAELTTLREQILAFDEDTNFAAFERQSALRFRGYRARLSQALADPPLPDRVTLVPLPFVGDGCYGVSEGSRRYVVVNPTAHIERSLAACVRAAAQEEPREE